MMFWDWALDPLEFFYGFWTIRGILFLLVGVDNIFHVKKVSMVKNEGESDD